LQAWKIADLGYQTVLSIMAAKDRSWRMEQLLHNFPAQASSLSGVRVSSDIRQIFQSLYSMGLVQTGGMNSVLVNGVPIDLSSPSFCIFDVIKAIQTEYKRVEEFNQLPYPPSVKRTLKIASEKVASAMAAADSGGASVRSGQAPTMQSITRIDISKGGKNVVLFYNNLERDPMYSNFASSVKTLLRPSWSLHSIAKNLYTLVAVIDPLTREGSELALTLQQMQMNQAPIRVGFVLDPRRGQERARAPVTDISAYLAEPAVAADFIRLFSLVKSREKLRNAFDFLFYISGETLNSGDEEDEDVMEILESEISAGGELSSTVSKSMTRGELVDLAFSFLINRKHAQKKDSLRSDLIEALISREKITSSDKKKVSSASADEDEAVDLVEEGLEYLNQRGLPKNSFSFNGIVLPSADVHSQMMQLLGREQYFLSNLVREGTLTDKTKSAFNVIMKESKTYLRYHQVLNEKVPTYLPFDEMKISELVDSVPYLYKDSNSATSLDSKLSDAPNSAMMWFPLTKNGLRDSMNAIRWINISDSKASASSRIAVVSMSAFGQDGRDADALFETVEGEDEFAAVLYTIMSAGAPLSDLSAATIGFIEDVIAFPDVAKATQKLVSLYPAFKYIEGAVMNKPSGYSSPSTARSIANSLMFSKQRESEYGLEDADETSYLCANCASHSLLVFNSRIVKVAPGTSHYLDFDIFASVEERRLNVPLRKQLKASGMSCADVVLSTADVDCKKALASSFVFFAAYVGGSAKKNTNRIDIKGVLTLLMDSRNLLTFFI
jgi:hypothetical protein